MKKKSLVGWVHKTAIRLDWEKFSSAYEYIKLPCVARNKEDWLGSLNIVKVRITIEEIAEERIKNPNNTLTRGGEIK